MVFPSDASVFEKKVVVPVLKRNVKLNFQRYTEKLFIHAFLTFE